MSLTIVPLAGAAKICVPGFDGFSKPFALLEHGQSFPKCSPVDINITSENVLSLEVKTVNTVKLFVFFTLILCLA